MQFRNTTSVFLKYLKAQYDHNISFIVSLSQFYRTLLMKDVDGRTKQNKSKNKAGIMTVAYENYVVRGHLCCKFTNSVFLHRFILGEVT